MLRAGGAARGAGSLAPCAAAAAAAARSSGARPRNRRRFRSPSGQEPRRGILRDPLRLTNPADCPPARLQRSPPDGGYAAFLLRRAAPDPVRLMRGECELQALPPHPAPRAHRLRLVRLVVARPGRGNREENVWVSRTAGRRVPPVTPGRTLGAMAEL